VHIEHCQTLLSDNERLGRFFILSKTSQYTKKATAVNVMYNATAHENSMLIISLPPFQASD
jgi:hypothetical protein